MLSGGMEAPRDAQWVRKEQGDHYVASLLAGILSVFHGIARCLAR
jgi:hypothetical protein